MPKNAIIVGMARSGTSLTASIFANRGYFVADDPVTDLQNAGSRNPSGYWEPRKLIEANVDILRSVGFEQHNTWIADQITHDQADAIYSVRQKIEHKRLLSQYMSNQPWVWKDPRFCYTLCYWWPLVDPKATGVLLITRDPDEILRSFSRIKWRDSSSDNEDRLLRIVQCHIDAARSCIKRFDIPHIEIDYSDYANKPEEVAERISNFFEIELSPHELGYRNKYNHSSVRGYLESCVEKIAAAVPESPRRLVKNITPKFLKRILFPSRNE
jgi:hypothetical protein